MTDLRENPSASPFFNPSLYLIEKSYRDNSAGHQCPVASSLLLSRHMLICYYQLTLQICSHIDVHGICGKHSTFMPRILVMLVTGNAIHSSDELFFKVTIDSVNSIPFRSLFSSTIMLVVSNVALVLTATGRLSACFGCILTVFKVLADCDDLSVAFTY